MMRAGAAALGLAGLLLAAPVHAEPDGASWGHSGADDGRTCTACHQGPAETRPTLSLDGLPQRPQAGETYELILALAGAGPLNGMQVELVAGGGDAGRFVTVDKVADVEVQGARARSIGGGPRWRLQWQAGQDCDVRFHIAAVAGNDDLSPFGDAVVAETVALPCAAE